MTTRYAQVAERDEIWQWLDRLRAQTLVVDIEPLVAFWNTDEATLEDGVSGFLEEVSVVRSVRVVLFATNSARSLPGLPAVPGLRVGYVSSARKPLRPSAYQGLPPPGVVIGDQVATDGVLARRLGYAFLHYCPNLTDVPLGPRLMRHLGRPVRAVLFRRPQV